MYSCTLRVQLCVGSDYKKTETAVHVHVTERDDDFTVLKVINLKPSTHRLWEGMTSIDDLAAKQSRILKRIRELEWREKSSANSLAMVASETERDKDGDATADADVVTGTS